MSVYLMGLTWKCDLPPSQKYVLLALCDRANDEGESIYLLVSTLAEKCSMSERTVQRQISDLVEARLVVRIDRPMRANELRINVDLLESLAALKAKPRGGDNLTGGDKSDISGVTDCHPNTLQALSITKKDAPPRKTKKRKTAAEEKIPYEGFDLNKATVDAVETFLESSLVKANGGHVDGVTLLGLETKKGWVLDCALTASAICEQQYDAPTITRQFWVEYWSSVMKDDFRAGRMQGTGKYPNWKPTFEYLLKPEAMVKVFEAALETA